MRASRKGRKQRAKRARKEQVRLRRMRLLVGILMLSLLTMLFASTVEAAATGSGPTTLSDYIEQWKSNSLFVLLVLVGCTVVPFLVFRKVFKSMNTVRIATQICFLFAINIGYFGFWKIRSETLPMGLPLPGAVSNYLRYNVTECMIYQMEDYLSNLGLYWQYLVMALIIYSILALAIGRAWCGWTCPLGLLQDGMNSIREALHIKKFRLTPKHREALAITKYSIFFGGVILAIFIGIPVIDAILPTNFYRPFEYLCPAYPFWAFSQYGLGLGPVQGVLDVIDVKTVALVTLVVFIVTSFKIRRPFCRLCFIAVPLEPFNKVSGLSLHKDVTKCTKCGMCYRSCPHDIIEVMEEDEKDDVTTRECILCMRCVEMCPEEKCLSARFFGVKVTESSYRKFMMQYPLRVRKMMSKYFTKPQSKGILTRFKPKTPKKVIPSNRRPAK